MASLGAVGRPSITRRGALGLGLAAGLGSLIAPLRSAPALGATRRVRGFGMTVGPADFGGARTSRVLRAPRRFEIVGLRGQGRVEVRVRRRGGAWSDWVALAAQGDHAPDTGSGERASDPLWSGGSDELQLRLARAPRGPLRLHLVSVPSGVRRRVGARAARARARAAQAPGTPPAIIPRDAWGAAAVPPRGDASYGTVQLAFVHHTVTVNEYGPGDSAAIVLGIAKYHRDTNGWNDIGYNFLVDRYGQVFEGRAGGVDQAGRRAPRRRATTRCRPASPSSARTPRPASPPRPWPPPRDCSAGSCRCTACPTEGAVAVPSAGGDMNRYPAGQVVTLQRISGHRDGDATSCPGDVLYAQLPELRTRATDLAGPVVAAGRVTIAATERRVLYGAAAAFAGTVMRPGGSLAAGEAVSLQKKAGGGRWVTVARTTADTSGVFAARVPWRRSGQVRARAAGLSSPVTSVSVTPRVQVRTPRSRRLHSGAILRLSGRVRPAEPMRVVVEIKGADGRWKRVRLVRARVRRTSWRTGIRMGKPGLYRITARTAGPGRRGVADPLLVRVLR